MTAIQQTIKEYDVSHLFHRGYFQYCMFALYTHHGHLEMYLYIYLSNVHGTKLHHTAIVHTYVPKIKCSK